MFFDLPPTPATYRWVGILVGGLVFSILGSWVPRFFQQREEPRSHNGIRLFGETLARQQIVYMVYIMALRGANFRSGYEWAVDWLNVFLGGVLLSYLFCIAFTASYRRMILLDHTPCLEACRQSLRRSTQLKMLMPPLVPAVAALYVAVLYAFLVGSA